MNIRLRAAAGVLSLLLLLSACGGPSAATDPPAASSSAPSGQAGPALDPTPESTPEPTPEPTPTLYQFGTPVVESAPLGDDSYFEDAAFVGDSRTEGLRLYGNLRSGDYLYRKSMSVFHTDDIEYPVEVNGQKVTLLQALKQKQYGKVYIMLGLNELGYPAKNYEAALRDFLSEVIAAQPGAVIYLDLMPPVNESMTSKDWLNNENVKIRNEINTRVATEMKIALLNVAEPYTGEDGQLPAEMTRDGCHFTAEAYNLWADYMRSHIIDRDWYFASREGAQ